MMKALVMRSYGVFSYEDVNLPQISDTQVLVKVKDVAICGSDVIGSQAVTGRRIPPIIMGHEAAGEIVRIGKAVKGRTIGQRVTFDSTEYCGICRFCKQGMINLCDNRRVLGVSCDEYRRDGAMAEYVAIEDRTIYPLPDSVSFREACLVEPLSIGVHAVMISPIKLGDTVVVYGAGTIGLMTLLALKVSGAGTVVAIDMDDAKLSLAESMGADAVINSKSQDIEKVFASIAPQGADLVFDAVGIEVTNNTGIQLLRKGGTMVMIGNSATKISFPLQYCVTRQIRIQGSCASSGEYARCLRLIANKSIDLSPFMQTVMPLREGAQAFRRLMSREPHLLKVILEI